MSIEIRHLRQFLAVAEELHFTRAAERLHLAQPALSAQIKKLEQELEVQLLVRSTRAVELTPAGQEFAARARHTVESYDTTLATAAQLRRGGGGHVSLGVSSRLRPALRREFIRELGLLTPRLAIDFVSESTVRLVQAVTARQVDAALVVAPSQTASLRSVRVRDAPLVAALPAEHALADRSEITLWDLRDELWIMPSADVFASNSLMHAMCLEAGFRLRVSSAATSNYDDDFIGVGEGSGIEVVPDVFTRPGAVADVAFVPVAGATLPLYLVAQSDGDGRRLGPLFKAVRSVLAGDETDAG